MSTSGRRLSYREAGVDVAAAERFVSAIGGMVRSTHTAAVVSHPSPYAGLIRPEAAAGMSDPLIAATCDGVGTKPLLARDAVDFEILGRDLVAMSVNDLLPIGARPLLFLDYLASGRLDAERLESAVRGIAAACREAGCALLGGETAEMPGVYGEGVVELSGFAVGLVDGAGLPDPSTMRPGDAVIALPSTGLHANGFSLARRALLEDGGLGLDDAPAELGGRRLVEVLLTPTPIYVGAVLDLMAAVTVKAAAHVTGGGLSGRARGLSTRGTDVVLDESRFERPPIFDLIHEAGDVSWEEMRRTFNMGLGFLAVVGEEDSAAAEERGWLRVGVVVESTE